MTGGGSPAGDLYKLPLLPPPQQIQVAGTATIGIIIESRSANYDGLHFRATRGEGTHR